MMLYTIRHLTGIAPEIMCYLIIGMKLTIDVREQKNKKGSSTGDQSSPTREIKEKETKLQKNLISSRTSKIGNWRKPGKLVDTEQDTESEDSD